MKASAAQVDITPPVGIELSGFVAREQPSTGVHDPLFAAALFLDDESGGILLWVHADVIGFESGFCDSVRGRLAEATGLRTDQVILSATHTHSGPPTITLNNCGAWRPGDVYQPVLEEALIEVGVRALGGIQSVQLTVGQSQCGLNRDRRGFASAHVDRRCSALGVRRLNGDYLAVLANYPCHPVSLGGENRQISRDLFGSAADHVSKSLPGAPVVLLTNGACGNLNPPRVGVDFRECEAYGIELGDAVLSALAAADPIEGSVRSKGEMFDIEAESLTCDEIVGRAEAVRQEILAWNNEWTSRASDAVETWKRSMLESPAAAARIDLRLHAARIGPLKIACLGAECFSVMSDMLRSRCGEPLVIVGYANGEVGYLCPTPAYEEGGYEVASAFVYYNAPPVKKGEFEHASLELATLLGSL